jgi:diaminopropionate ammonia-lyase
MLNPTPLLDLPAVADRLHLARVWVKDESKRELGNFKSLGGMHAAALVLAGADKSCATLICASDGNHGLAVAAAAQAGGTRARIYLPGSTERSRVDRIERRGAAVVIVDGSYDEAVRLAEFAARNGEGILIADTSPDVDDLVVATVIDGYSVIATEIIDQLDGDWPTHLFIQAGVGGLAAAVAGGLLCASRCRQLKIVIVEPAAAACVGAALAAGAPMQISGTLETCAAMLSCGLASAGAVARLRRWDCDAITVDEIGLASAPQQMIGLGGPATTPSGAAGFAGLMKAAEDTQLKSRLRLNHDSRIILVVTEGSLQSAP